MCCIGSMVNGACTSDFIWCRLVLWFDFVPQTAAITTSRGEYLGLCVLLQRRLVGALVHPWLERGVAEKIGRFVAPWLFDFSDLVVLRAGGPVYLRLPSEKSHILCYYKSSVVLAPTYVGRYLPR